MILALIKRSLSFDDESIKDFVKNKLFSVPPAEMTRELIRHIYNGRTGSSIPAKLQDEIKKVAAKMGVDITGADPNRSIDQILAKIDDETLKQMAVEWMPKLFGLARARRYMNDRLRINLAQAAYLRSMYGDDFFKNVIEKSKEMETFFRNYFSGDFANIPAKIGDFLREKLIGKDWVDFLKKLLIVIAIVGSGPLVGAGVSGGLVGLLGGAANLGLALGKRGIVEAGKLGNILGDQAGNIRPK